MLHVEGCHMKIANLKSHFFCISQSMYKITTKYYHVLPQQQVRITNQPLNHPTTPYTMTPIDTQPNPATTKHQPGNTHNLPNIHQATPRTHPKTN